MESNAIYNILKFYKEIGLEYMRASSKAHKQTLSKLELLNKLKKEVESCKSCELYATRKNYVFGDGNIDAKLMFIGEAPGAAEDEQGLPFVGRAGQLLSELLKEVGIKRDEVYIANCLKCRPPNNRDPQESELNACRPFLDKQIDLIKPKVIVTLGRFSMMELLGRDKKISQCRGQLFKVNDYIVIPTYHPAYLLRNPKAIEVFVADLSKIKQYLVD